MNLKYWRKKRGLTQLKLAKISGVAQSSISEIESGKTSPNVITAVKLATALNVPVTDLVYSRSIEIKVS